MADIQTESQRRRTFAIISHPDAGKTTLTEKLLLFGGAIQLAGQVRAKGDRRRTRSDWMAIERARGISVVTSVMTFEYNNVVFNLLDTPGHEDFSEDTYRTLTAVDAAVMVIDGAKGIEDRTRKLFEICRLRDIPIITFINKFDREAQEPLALLDEIEKGLALTVVPMVWPIGIGKTFAGTYDLIHHRVRRVDEDPAGVAVSGPGDKLIDEILPQGAAHFREEIELQSMAGHSFDQTAFLEGHLSPVFFGSAIKNFGVRDLLDALIAYAPSPRDQKARQRVVKATEPKLTGVVFKIQANMDPNHRDRIAFMRVCSGKLTRGMKTKIVRTGKQLALNAPQFFFAQDRSLAEEAFAGDVVGIPNHGVLRIGDTLSEGEDVVFTGVPSFAPEILRRVRLGDPMKAKKLKSALEELAEEGVVQLFTPIDGSGAIVGVVGALQLDVLADRLEHEYGVPASFETTRFEILRWITAPDSRTLEGFVDSNKSGIAHDLDGAPVFMASSAFNLNYALERAPGIAAATIKEIHA
ncbi:MAG: peptide chain release factor 3 [Alphaproteobacteria bacterium]|nr:peptide chain release factor 3 [Alphaproteobacteria bacterium]